jgi:hypothetical protein
MAFHRADRRMTAATAIRATAIACQKCWCADFNECCNVCAAVSGAFFADDEIRTVVLGLSVSSTTLGSAEAPLNSSKAAASLGCWISRACSPAVAASAMPLADRGPAQRCEFWLLRCHACTAALRDPFRPCRFEHLALSQMECCGNTLIIGGRLVPALGFVAREHLQCGEAPDFIPPAQRLVGLRITVHGCHCGNALHVKGLSCPGCMFAARSPLLLGSFNCSSWPSSPLKVYKNWRLTCKFSATRW